MSTLATIRVGVTRTTNSGGTPLRRPNSSARPAPMYRPPMRAAHCTRSPADAAAIPATVTKLNGGRSSSQHSDTRGIAQDGLALDRVRRRHEHDLVAVEIDP